MANRLHILANQAVIDLGGDEDALGETWDLVQTGHYTLLSNLGNRVTEDTPLRRLWRKKLEGSDASSQQARFVIRKHVAEGAFFRCLSLEQRRDLGGTGIQVQCFNEQEQKWQLQLMQRVQNTNGSITYVFLGEWGKMVRENGWRKGTVISIWGFPYGGIRDRWEYGPQHGFNEIYLVVKVED